MKTIAIIVQKIKFDLILGKYLSNFFSVKYLVPDPKDALLLQINNIPFVKLFDLPSVEPEERDFSLALKAIRYPFWPSKAQKNAPIRVASLREFLLDFIIRHNIAALITTDKYNYSSLVAFEVAKERRIPILFTGQGFFRKRSTSASPIPFRVFDPQIWEKRLCYYQKFPPPGVEKIRISKEYKLNLKRPSIISKLICRFYYSYNPFFLKRHPDLYPVRSPLKSFFHKRRKNRFKRQTISQVSIKEPFVLLPLQGDEICAEIKGFLPIKNMKNLIEIVIQIFTEKKLHQKYNLVIKEHPNRPFIISDNFVKNLPSWVIFLRKFDMQYLLDFCSFLVTYNSLSGFEAIGRGKPVICFAPIFYNLSGLVLCPHNMSEFAQMLELVSNFFPDPKRLNALYDFIWKFIDLPCSDFSRKSPNIKSLELIIGRLKWLISNKYFPPEELL